MKTLAILLILTASASYPDTIQPPAPQTLPRTSAHIDVDGDLQDPGWKDALIVDRFYETQPANNIQPKVKTTALLTYDDAYFYIGIKADDPEPQKIRAPYVERDQVIGTDDNVAVFLDTRNTKKTAIELRVSPRGIQADGIYDDPTTTEDFSPDFFYDTAAKITSEGWQAEFRIPLTTLRYPQTEPQTWGILIWRNYPRDFRYFIHSSPIPRGSNCLVCHSMQLTGITQLPSSRHLVAAPYATASHLRNRDNLADDSDFSGSSDANIGADIKWNPTANSAIDGTINPDFSQVEADIPQIAENQRFALFFPEKRPFFLESAELFNSPIQLVYSRTITDPNWGLRATGKTGNTSYTFLSARDSGGGLLVLPGPIFSEFALQDFDSTVTLGRVRHDFGLSFGSFMFTDREISGGGHNRVLGPDAQWRPTDSDFITGQFLFSSTKDPEGLPLFGPDSSNSHAAMINWDRQKYSYDWRLRYRDIGDDFRADVGFVPQVGYREVQGSAGWHFYPVKIPWMRFARVYGVADKLYLTDGEDLGHDYFPGIYFIGSLNLVGQFEYHDNKVRISDDLLTQRYFQYFVQFDPSRRFPRITVQGRMGDLIDFDNARVGQGNNISLQATIRPFDHLTLVADVAREWLDLDEADASGRLYTANIQRLKATYVFNARSFIRAIGQYVRTTRNPDLYTFVVPRRDGNFLASILYGYRLNWQTVLFVGYGDTGIVNENDPLIRTNRSIFLKLSYAWQR